MPGSRLLRAAISEAEHHRLRVLAAEAGEERAEFIARALRKSPVTRKAFQTKETK